jgi:hypothetical protein
LIRSAKMSTIKGLFWSQRHHSVCRIWCADGAVTSTSGAANASRMTASGMFGATSASAGAGAAMRTFPSCHKKSGNILYYIYCKYIISIIVSLCHCAMIVCAILNTCRAHLCQPGIGVCLLPSTPGK